MAQVPGSINKTIPSILSNKLITTDALWNILSEMTTEIYNNIPQPETVDISGKADKHNTLLTGYLKLDSTNDNPLSNTVAIGINNQIYTAPSVAIGAQNKNRSDCSLTVGNGNKVTSSNSVGIGYFNCAFGENSFSSGRNTIAFGAASHAEGQGVSSVSVGKLSTKSSANKTIVQLTSKTSDYYSYIEPGYALTNSSGEIYIVIECSQENEEIRLNKDFTSSTDDTWTLVYGVAYGASSHVEGYDSVASGDSSHAEGFQTFAQNSGSHSEGSNSRATGHAAHAEGGSTIASNGYSHAEGHKSQATGEDSHAEGYQTLASSSHAHAEGNNTQATASGAHAEGESTTASGDNSHAEGYLTKATGKYSHAEGERSEASGVGTHAEGHLCKAPGHYSHAEGFYTEVRGESAHVEGWNTIATGAYSHVIGTYNIEDSYENWPSWNMNTSYKIGDKIKITQNNSLVGYKCVKDNNDSVFDEKNWRLEPKQNWVEIVGNGNTNRSRSNARTLDWDGNEWLAGNITVNGGSLTLHDQDGDVTITAAQLRSLLATLQ